MEQHKLNQLQQMGQQFALGSTNPYDVGGQFQPEVQKSSQNSAELHQNAQFTCTMKDLLNVKLKDFQLEFKHIAFNEFKKALSPEDLTQRMQYVRCDQPIEFSQKLDPSDILLQQLSSSIHGREDFYKYEKPDEWYVNFADYNLFGFYYSTLYAQDELQVLEHPLLAHVLEYAKILAEKDKRLTPIVYSRSQDKQNYVLKLVTSNQTIPTPILITNAHRLGHIDISNQQNPYAYYGNNFQHIPQREFSKRLTVFKDERKVTTNIIAMAAMGHQKGKYTIEQVTFTLMTAYKSFLNAKFIHQKNCDVSIQLSSSSDKQQSQPSNKPFVVHTGNWGTGAFGNNVEIIAVIQILAALMAKVDQLDYHTFNKSGTKGFTEGWKFVGELLQSKAQWKVDDIILKIVEKGFKWGISNGT